MKSRRLLLPADKAPAGTAVLVSDVSEKGNFPMGSSTAIIKTVIGIGRKPTAWKGGSLWRRHKRQEEIHDRKPVF